MKRITLLISAAFLLLAGCTKEQLVEERSYAGSANVVKATFESLTGDSATKAAVTDAGTFTWQNGDQAAFAVDGDSDSYIKGTNSSTSATASFELEKSGSFSSSSWAIYPFDLTTEQIPTSLKVTVPASRVWAQDQTNVAMYGKYETASSSFSFFHMGGLVRIEVNNVPTNARKFVFKTSGYKINGVFTPEVESENKVIKTEVSENEDEQTYTLTWANTPSSTNKTVFYVPLPVGEYENGFAFYLKDGDDNILYSKVGTTSQPVARKQLLLMPAINLVGGSIEPIEKAAVVQEVPAGHSGDFLLANSEKVLLKVNASAKDNDITLKYNGGNLPTNLEIQVVGGKAFDKTISGDLPKTHVDFTTGEIANVEMTTSASTFEIIYPAKISEKLTVKGGNVKVKGATVAKIEVDKDAKADGNKAPVEIVVEKANIPEFTAPDVTAKANVVVAPAADVTVKVTADDNVKVANGGAGYVNDKNDQPINTKAAAQIDSIKYITLADAIAAVKNDEVIKLIAEVADAKGITVPSGKNFTVDFGGFTYTCASDPAGSDGTKNQVFQLLKNSTITFKNGTINVKEDAKSQFRFIIQNYANLTLEDITLDGTNLAISDGRVNYTVSNNYGTVVFKGGTKIKAAATKGVAFDVCKSNDNVNYPEPPTVTVNTTDTIKGQVEVTGGKLDIQAGTFTSDVSTILIQSGEVTVSGGAISSTKKHAIAAKGGKVTLTDGTFSGPEGAVIFPGVGATIDIQNGTYTATDNAVIAGNGSARTGDKNTVTIKGGTFNGQIKTSGYIACGIYAPWKDDITVTGGTFNITGGAGVVARAGVVTINGGTFNVSGTGTGWVGNNKNLILCECLVFDAAANYPAKDANSKIVVNGGTFSDESAIKYAAKNANITIKLQADRTQGTGVFVKPDQNQIITFDLNGNKYIGVGPAVGSTSTTNQLFHIERGNKVTLKNGKISISESAKNSFKFVIQNYSNLNVEGVELDGTNLGISGGTTFSNNYGTVSVTGNTSIKAAANGVALDAYYWPEGGYQEGVNVTVNTTGTITGKVDFAHDDTATDEQAANCSSLKIEAGNFTDMSGVNYVADNGTYKLANNVTLANPLEITSGKTFTVDLNSKTLTGRTNIKHGNVTFKNGNINGGSQQALNVYGSSESSATNYSVVTVDSDANVKAEVFGVCLFGPTAGSFEGYGAGVDIKGTVTTTKTSSSNEGAVFVSGNLGGGKDANTQTAMEGKNFVNISGTVTSASDAALALQGSATATITGNLTGNTGIAAKRGKLIVKDNAVITGTGTCVGNPTPNGDGTELTGSAVSASSTYGQRLTVDLQGGTYTSAAYTILNNADDAACSFAISGGKYETTKVGDGIAVYARLGSVNITGGEFINASNSEATLHVGCPAAVEKSLQPTLTISGSSTVVKNNATEAYPHKSGWKALTVNMANEINNYKAVTISGGEFHGQKPDCDDSWTEQDTNGYKKFLAEGYEAKETSTGVWTVSVKNN